MIDEADRVMEDVQNDWLTHVEKAVYSGSRAASAGLPINCATAMRMDVPLQKLLFSATLSQNPEKLQELSLYEPKLFTSANIGNLQNQEEEEKHDFVGKFTTPAELTETILKVDNSLQKPLLLANLIKQRNMKKGNSFFPKPFLHTVRNLHFLSKNSTLISRENCRFFGVKNS